MRMSAELTRRTQFLLDEARYARLERRSQRTGASIGALLRQAVDLAYPPERSDATGAARAFREAEPMPVEDWPEMKRELRDSFYGDG